MNIEDKRMGVIFDMNGTIIDDMAYHASAWHELLVSDLGCDIDINRVWNEMYGKNRDMFIRVLGEGALSEEEMESWSLEKERRYQKIYGPHAEPISGFIEFLNCLKSKGLPIALGTAAIPFNVNFILERLQIKDCFDAVVSADDVEFSKPHPETFIKCAELLAIPENACVVFEDSPKGVEAAQRAGMKAIVLTTMHPKEDFSGFTNILGIIENYQDPFLFSAF